jgi:uncharacterized protein (TIGR02284 family)
MENSDIIDVLNDLIETSKDGEYGFDACAKHASSSHIAELFKRRAEDCHVAAQELQNLVRQHGGTPEEDGTTTGAMHRGWVAVLGTIAGNSDERMLDEAERGEDKALARYRNALQKEDLPPLIRIIVQRQMAGVQDNHDQIKALRDRAKIEV